MTGTTFEERNADLHDTTPPPGRPRSAPECLLVAARTLGQPFGLSALVLAAWGMFPERFGLPGMKGQHPSDNAVKAALYGPRGAKAKGLLVQVGPNRFRVNWT